MGLDLLAFGADSEDEIDGFRIGRSSDFDHFRHIVRKRLSGGDRPARFPLLMRGTSVDASWSADECRSLERELSEIALEFSRLPAQRQPGVWGQAANAERTGEPTSLLESFVTIDGELFVLRFIQLAQLVQKTNGVLRTD